MGKKGCLGCFHDCKMAIYQILCLQSEDAFSKQYEIQPGELGRGRYTVVKKAVNRTTGAEVAVKEIYKGSCDEEEIDAAYEEVKIMRIAKHPNCIQLYEVIETPMDLYIMMELATGGQLFDRIIARHHFSEQYAAKCFLQVMDALLYLHKKGVAHRDLKAENILFADETDDAAIKICDFGLGKVAHRTVTRGFRRMRLKSLVGTPAYAAPEVFDGKYGLAVDVWSSGVILYVMLSGVFPWKMDGGVEEIIEQAKSAKYEFPTESWGQISNEAKDLVRGMIELDTGKRLTSSACMKHPWMERARMGQISDVHLPQAHHRMRSASVISAEQMVSDLLPTTSAAHSVRGSRKSSTASGSAGVGTKTPLSGAKRPPSAKVVEVVQNDNTPHS